MRGLSHPTHHALPLLIGLLLLTAVLPYAARAQQTDSTRLAVPIDTARVDTAALQPDSLAATPLFQDPRFPIRPPSRTGDAGLTQPVTFTARDSLILTFDEAEQGTLFGLAHVVYNDATLDAHQIDILFERDELAAQGVRSDTGWVGRPRFVQGSEQFDGLQLAYNMQTERGRVEGVQTQMDDGFIRAGIAKVTEDSTIYIRDGQYTTCECDLDETPSYSLRSSKMKVVDQKWIYTGPLQLFIYNIATPLWLPFGFLPATEGRRSGPLAPSYGEDDRGFYLRDWGWYWALNDYMDLQLQGGIWTKGSWQVATQYRYKRRYAYEGQLNLNYARNRNGERDDPDFSVFTTTSVRWNHRQDLNPTASFNADVNLSTSGYLRTISEQYDDRVTQTLSSSVTYNKRWNRRNLRLTATHRQSLADNTVNLTLPTLNFSQSSSKPFARDTRGPGEAEQWYEKVTYSYTGTVTNRFDFRPLSDSLAEEIAWYEAFVSPSQYRRATGKDEPFVFKTTHRIPINASFTLATLPITITPNFSYTEDWFLRTLRRTDATDSTSSQEESVPGFFALRQFNTGVSSSTTFYGLFPVGVGPYQGLRHTVRPSLSYTYQPDFFASGWGYTRTYLDQNGDAVPYAIVSGVRNGEQQRLTYALNNTFETKRVRTDTTGTEQREALKLFNLDFSSSYNLAADSLRMGAITMNGRTTLFGKVTLNLRTTYSPYRRDSTGRTLNDYVFDLRRARFARLTNLSFTASTSFNNRGNTGTTAATTGIAEPAYDPDDPFRPYDSTTPFGQRATGYVDFAIPWSLKLDFTYSRAIGATRTTRRMSLNANTDFNLTPRWKIQLRTGYDFEQKEIVTTNLSLYRDFDCWTMSANWVPFGLYQSWGFTLQVKSGHLRDLLRIQQPKSDVQGRFTGLLN